MAQAIKEKPAMRILQFMSDTDRHDVSSMMPNINYGKRLIGVGATGPKSLYSREIILSWRVRLIPKRFRPKNCSCFSSGFAIVRC